MLIMNITFQVHFLVTFPWPAKVPGHLASFLRALVLELQFLKSQNEGITTVLAQPALQFYKLRTSQ